MTAALFCLLALASVAQPVRVDGTVIDLTGAAIPGATVQSGTFITTTDARGRFTIALDDPRAALRVSAPGFQSVVVARATGGRDLRVVLYPAPLAENVMVTAGSSGPRIEDTSVAATTLAASTLLTSATSTLDDALRSIPGFSLFRRSSSRVANPTTQGAGLRGLSASGASRVLVLADGVPMNDPFGSWVQWGRVPLVAIDRVEVLRGGSAGELYGSEAVGGVVQVISIKPAARAMRGLFEGGQRGYGRGSGYLGGRSGAWSGFAAAERLVFDGYVPVAPAERGSVDAKAGVEYWSAIARGASHLDGLRVEARAGWFGEDRANGTPLQSNQTDVWDGALRASGTTAAGALSLAAYVGDVAYDQSFSAVSSDRDAEFLTALQRVDSRQAGLDAHWAQAWGAAAILGGAEVRRVRGTSVQTSFSQGVRAGVASAGGTQHRYAGYGQISLQPRDVVTLIAGLRATWWKSDPEGAGRSTSDAFVFPRVSAAWRSSDRTSLHVTWTATGRTPTLNELHRDFRVGNVFTRANPELDPERARTLEGGLLVRAGGATARTVGFWTRVSDAISNVTLTAGGPLILRERRNAGAIRVRGAEAELEWRARSWALAASASLLDSIFSESLEAGLAGNRVPQVPRWHTSLSVKYAAPRAILGAEWRSSGPQFDDDRNQFRLRGASTLDLYASGRLGRCHLFVAVENLLDAEVEAGRTPVTTLGLPRTIRAGLRVIAP